MRKEWIQSKLPTVATKATGHFHIAMLQSGNDSYNIANGTTKHFVSASTAGLIDKVKTAINKGVTGI